MSCSTFWGGGALEDTGFGGKKGGIIEGNPQNSFSINENIFWFNADTEKLPSYFWETTSVIPIKV
jgi:hypothetical protein